MRQIAFAEGLRAGALLSVGVVILAIVGLTPSFSWVPELPLVGTAVLLPLVVYSLVGVRSALRTRRVVAGVLGGALAGVISGGIGGLTYVFFGKSLLNVAVGIVVGAAAGSLFGALGAQVGLRRQALRPRE